MRVCLWHGWLLEGSGSSVYTAKVAEILRRFGHDVLVLCQERHPDRLGFFDAAGAVGEAGISAVRATGAPAAAGRAVLLRPDIGELLPVFVIDDYEGFRVERFVDLTDAELEAYLERNAVALKAATAWHDSDVVIAGHAVPGPAVALRALGAGAYTAKIHGSDLEFAMRPQHRYAELAREGLEGATIVTGASDDVLRRLVKMIPSIAGRVRRVPPGVQVERFHPAPRPEALASVALDLEGDPETARGRPASMSAEVEAALAARDAEALDALPHRYDQGAPDPGAAARLRALAGFEGSLVGYFGKLILLKGVERVLESLALLGPGIRGLVIGFGLFREWLEALALALDRGDAAAAAWLRRTAGMQLESTRQLGSLRGVRQRIAFTGVLDHRYAPGALAALDILVVPSTGPEAFGMVAAEGAAAGALPLVARHSGLAEVAATLESAVGHPGLFSFEPGPGATRRLTAGIERILSLAPPERAALRADVASFAAAEWTWERTAERLLEAVSGR